MVLAKTDLYKYHNVYMYSVVELSFRKDRVHTVSMRALCARIFTARA